MASAMLQTPEKQLKRPPPVSGDDDYAMETKKRRLSTDAFTPRSYQVTIYEEALRRNTIAVLDTGSGKTVIAVMLIKEFSRAFVDGGRRRLILFLAPTVHLVEQQYEVIKIHTGFDTMSYHGAKGVDNWNREKWEEEASSYAVMVMTPQILLDALRKAFLTLDIIRLIIFDECHRATGSHPYTRIMKEFYHKSLQKPAIFGMTASPLVRKGVSSETDCEDQLSELESILDSKIYTVADRREMERIVPAAKEVNRYYDPMMSIHEDLKTNLGSLLASFDALMTSIESPLYKFRDAEEVLNRSRKDSSSWHGKICHCLDDLGLICANEAAKICLDSLHLPYYANGGDLSSDAVLQCNTFLEEAKHTIEDGLKEGYEELLNTELGCLESTQLGYISPKLFVLLQLLSTFGSDQVRCLIFVERIITARVIERLIKKISYLSHLQVSYLTGGSSSPEALTPKLQKATLEQFRSGKINVLFTTNVAEEGLHVPECSCVIRFDLPKTVCSYVQSRGRARQAGSHYIVMLERGNIQQRDLLFNIIKSKHSMMDTASHRECVSLIPKLLDIEKTEAYYVESTGARVTADSSVNLIYQYCGKLPSDKYYTPRPVFDFTTCDGSCECSLTLPPNAAFQTIVGPLSQSNNKAKQLVCLDACKRLHQLGALNDHLLPVVEEESLETGPIKKKEKSIAGAGSTKRKELHGTTKVCALSGSWMHQKTGVTLQGYKLTFSCDRVDQKYSNFVLLMDTTLDKDVSSLDIDLYLVEKMVKASVSPCGPIELNAEQVEKAKRFQELFFNGLFGKLFKGSKSSGTPRKFLLEEDDCSLWTTSNMYMLLPLESTHTPNQDTISINWKGISASAHVVEFLSSAVVSGSNLVQNGCSNSDAIHFANKSTKLQSLKDMVVIAVHTGKLYSVIDVVDGSSADSPFDVPEFATYSEYFKAKYDIVLQHPGQPLLHLKHGHNPHNLLSSKLYDEGRASKKVHEVGESMKKPRNDVNMPPELLAHIDVPLDVLKSLYLLPSLMHRMESLMLASQLRKEIAFHPADSCISTSLILEAITTLRCCEDFCLERLELLGDSVLKYAVSCHLYLKFPEKHEGQLSSRRSRTVSNATLHKLGINRNVQGYIRDAPFDPRRWVAPGQLSNRPAPCKCGVDSSKLPCKTIEITEDKSIVIGKACDEGHRWICSKTISDCVEALIGAYYVGGGLTAALAVLKWLGIDIELESEMVGKAMTTSVSFWSCVPRSDDMEILEKKLRYEFAIKGLLLEAITHASEIGTSYCYQRLEFLGDAVLDLLITWHLFQTHTTIDPGVLTDLRSASVNNERFAKCAVKHKLQHHLQHSSGLLVEQITEYVKKLEELQEDECPLVSNASSKGYKVLADIVESIAGAILIDTRLNLHKVWEVFEPLLAPIVSPDSLELPPLRELFELCSHLGYFLNTKCMMEGDIAHVELSVQLENLLLVRNARDKNKKAAKGQAAFLLLKDLEKEGFSRKSKQNEEKVADDSSGATDVIISMPQKDNSLVESNKTSYMEIDTPVALKVQKKKGGPRTALFQLCQRLQWPMPRFEPEERKLSAEAAIGIEGKNGLQRFVSSITLHLPNSIPIKLKGDMQPDKKTSQDSAAMVMLYELQKQGRCSVIEV
ncbi:endoribonuclease Dicer-like protein 3a [Iris pallida]|uniref:Endoribonuclease Dicer-like protein 3a n=1 Tax=Iris pallida TaxID=29817 RepID=A0AAX6DQ73_IRIPA|nr:endoribonuclease Dicer-like protein 3a [Iris pallida]